MKLPIFTIKTSPKPLMMSRLGDRGCQQLYIQMCSFMLSHMCRARTPAEVKYCEFVFAVLFSLKRWRYTRVGEHRVKWWASSLISWHQLHKLIKQSGLLCCKEIIWTNWMIRGRKQFIRLHRSYSHTLHIDMQTFSPLSSVNTRYHRIDRKCFHSCIYVQM